MENYEVPKESSASLDHEEQGSETMLDHDTTIEGQISPFLDVKKRNPSWMMFWSTTRASELNEARDKWHFGWWSIKIVLWILFTIFPFLLPSALIELYG